MKLIGIAGSNGSGKDTAGHILATKHGFLFVSGTEILRNELRRRGQPIDRPHLSALSAEWRRELGFGMLIDKAIEVYNLATQDHPYIGLVTASLRHPAEADRTHELGGTVWWLDADPHIRYQRVQAAKRGRGGEDEKTYEQFLAEEAAEMTQSGDAATLNMSAVRELADVFIHNESAGLDTFTQSVSDAVNN